MTWEELLEVYADKNPRRSNGGLYALSGFDFQIKVYIANLVEQFSSSTRYEIGLKGGPLLESFSDLFTPIDDRAVCIQVKRAADKKTLLSKVAKEFIQLESFFMGEGVESSQRPKYRLVVQSETLGSDWSWSDIKPAQTKEGGIQNAESVWQSLIDERRVDLLVCSDPWWRIISATMPIMDTPFEFARQAVTLCLERREHTATDLRVRLADLYQKMRRSPNANRTLALNREDFESKSSYPSRLMVGYQPSLELLSDGQYLTRPTLINELCDRIEDSMVRDTLVDQCGLNIVWIAGKSGSGKSAFLLQVMGEMVGRGKHVVWASHKVSMIAPLLEDSIGGHQDYGAPDLIFVDDLYAPRNRNGLNLSSLENLVQYHTYAKWPVIVTCGPTEFLDSMSRDLLGFSFNFIPWQLPLLSEEEIPVFESWFRLHNPDIEKVARTKMGEEGLIVSMAFSWKYEDMSRSGFARRFRARLETQSLTAILQLHLSLNRLYIWSPLAWLSEIELENFRSLNQDEDFRLLEFGIQGELIRLTHPHISNIIYLAIRGTNSIALANDLANVINRCIPSDMETAKRLFRALCSHESTIRNRLRKVDFAHLADRCSATLRAWVASNEINIDARTDVMVSLACLHAERPEARLETILEIEGGLLGLARAEARANAKTWATSWCRLQAYYDKNTDLYKDALDWLVLNVGEKGWYPIWIRVHSWAEMSNLHQMRSSLMSVGISTLREDWDRPGCNMLWRMLLDGTVEKERNQLLFEAFNLLLESIQAGLPGPSWEYLWQDLLKEELFEEKAIRLRLLIAGSKWLIGREELKSWAFVFHLILNDPHLPHGADDYLVPLGVRWIESDLFRSNWIVAWEAIIGFKRCPLSAVSSLLKCGREWLGEQTEHPRWTQVWELLLEKSAGSEREEHPAHGLRLQHRRPRSRDRG